MEGGQRKEAVHNERVTITLLWEYNAPDIAPVFTQCQGLAGRHAVVVHQFEVPYGWTCHPE